MKIAWTICLYFGLLLVRPAIPAGTSTDAREILEFAIAETAEQNSTNPPFTESLIRVLNASDRVGVRLSDAFVRTAKRVKDMTGGRQVPWFGGADLTIGDYLLVPPASGTQNVALKESNVKSGYSSAQHLEILSADEILSSMEASAEVIELRPLTSEELEQHYHQAASRNWASAREQRAQVAHHCVRIALRN